MRKFELIIWDVDGTLLDTSEGMLSSVKYMIETVGLGMPDNEKLRSFVGPRIQDSLRRVYGLEGSSLAEAAMVFRNHYKKGDVLIAEPYDGIPELLKELFNNRFNQAIATNKRQDFVDALVSRFKFDKYIGCVRGTDLDGKKNKADLIEECIDYYSGIDRNEVVLIGDSVYDAEAAYATNINFVGVTYGFDFKSAKDVSDYKHVGTADSIEELKQILGI